MDPLMETALVFAALNCAALAGLLFLYAKIFVKSHAMYTGGLVVFAVFLLANTLFTALSYVTMTASFGDGVYPVLVVMNAAEFVGLVALVRVTL